MNPNGKVTPATIATITDGVWNHSMARAVVQATNAPIAVNINTSMVASQQKPRESSSVLMTDDARFAAAASRRPKLVPGGVSKEGLNWNRAKGGLLKGNTKSKDAFNFGAANDLWDV